MLTIRRECDKNFLKNKSIDMKINKDGLTGDPKLWPISWASVTWLTAGGTCFP